MPDTDWTRVPSRDTEPWWCRVAIGPRGDPLLEVVSNPAAAVIPLPPRGYPILAAVLRRALPPGPEPGAILDWLVSQGWPVDSLPVPEPIHAVRARGRS